MKFFKLDENFHWKLNKESFKWGKLFVETRGYNFGLENLDNNLNFWLIDWFIKLRGSTSGFTKMFMSPNVLNLNWSLTLELKF
jgi:hypothetical protein